MRQEAGRGMWGKGSQTGAEIGCVLACPPFPHSPTAPEKRTRPTHPSRGQEKGGGKSPHHVAVRRPGTAGVCYPQRFPFMKEPPDEAGPECDGICVSASVCVPCGYTDCRNANAVELIKRQSRRGCVGEGRFLSHTTHDSSGGQRWLFVVVLKDTTRTHRA